jgi:molybdate transport system ATP-binding protein
VLLLDEPLTALDPETAGEIRALLAEQLRAADATALVVTHDALDAASLASRLVMLEHGAITQAGPVREVLTTPATRFAAAVAGTNRLIGVASHGGWTTGSDTTPVVLHADDEPSRRAAAHDGAPLAAFLRPADVVLEPITAANPPPGAGEWQARIVRLDHTPGGARVQTADPPVAVDVSPDAVAAWALAPGMPVRLGIDPRKVRFAVVDGSHDTPSDKPGSASRTRG